MNAAVEEVGLKIYRGQTECMLMFKGMAPTCSIIMGNEQIQQVIKSKYLNILTENGDCESQIKQRIEIARSAIIKMRKVFSNR